MRRKGKLAKACYHSDIRLSLDFKFKISSLIAFIQEWFLHKKVSHNFPFIFSPPTPQSDIASSTFFAFLRQHIYVNAATT